MKAFIGMCVTMGVMRMPSRNDYWRRTKWLFRTSFNEVMPRDEFNQTWRYLHIQNNEEPIVGDKLWKVRWYLDFLCGKFWTMYIPTTGTYTVDESMVKFKGRLGFRQYMPAKPTKWGVKIWSLCDSITGYMSRFQVYTGRDGRVVEHGLSHRVVMDLMEGMGEERTYATVYMDNYYTSVPLLQDLRQSGLYGCGTVRANRRGLPTDLLPRNVRLRKHDFKIAQLNDITFGIWQDTKAVCVLSNCHSPYDVGQVRRRVDGHRQDVNAPKSLSDYQLFMKGVDLCDQMTGYYLLQHRSKKWWRRLFFYLLSVSMHNAYIVAKASHADIVASEWPNFQDFVEDLGLGLVGTYRSRRHAPVPPAPLRAQAVHHVVKFYEKNRVCRECSLRLPPGARPGVTKYRCEECQEPVHLTCQAFHVQRHNNA